MTLKMNSTQAQFKKFIGKFVDILNYSKYLQYYTN